MAQEDKPQEALRGNKIAAAILIAGLLCFGVAYLSDILYHPEIPAVDNQGYAIAIGDPATTSTVPTEEAFPEISPLLASADAEKGKVVAKKCLACHTFTKGGPNRVGPNMYNIVADKIAARSGYAYSKALKNLSAQQWDYETLNLFLYSPRKYVKGTKMGFAGLKKERDRANIILYLRSLSDAPIPLP